MKEYVKSSNPLGRSFEDHRIVDTPKGPVYVFNSYPGPFLLSAHEEVEITVVAGFFRGYVEGTGEDRVHVDPVPKSDQAVVSSAVRSSGFAFNIDYW